MWLDKNSKNLNPITMSTRISRFFLQLFLLAMLLPFLCFNSLLAQNEVIFQQKPQDTCGIASGIFSISELAINPSPANEKSFTFSSSEKIIDYDVSPVGINVAALISGSENRYLIKLWQIGRGEIADSCDLPKGLIAKAIVWHPRANSIFVMGQNGVNHEIYRVEKSLNSWKCNRIFTSKNRLRRLVICPRPFLTSWDSDANKETFVYRLFFGMDNGNQSYRIVSVTEFGNKLYQVVGPGKTMSKAEEFEAGANPSEIISEWALPLAFHPGGHELIWEDKTNTHHIAEYELKYWGKSKPLNIAINKSGTITPTPNGLGFIHWENSKPGIGVYLIASKKEETQITNFQFISTPSSVPDGKGIVGLTVANGCYTLNYVPINVPLADVTNAWMYAYTPDDINHFQQNFGLFRPNAHDQLYQLYETENYYCDRYDRRAPTRPYIVTTDLFWELFGAAYQGLFIVKERDEAIPNFWKFVMEADKHLKKTNSKSKWAYVFSALKDLNIGNIKNKEVVRINSDTDGFTEIINDNYAYSDLKPRGHYVSSPEMSKYFRAFRYFTTILKKDQEVMKELNQLPGEITIYAEKWISSYTGFISPSRSPMVWKNLSQTTPLYCKYPNTTPSLFPLSWGFDNEVLYSTVYHPNVPAPLQVEGRMLPSGIDLAAALGNGFAEQLLTSDYQQYPKLRNVIDNLKINFKNNSIDTNLNSNLYNQWINAIAIQWADSLHSTNGEADTGIWQTKRLQTGLATWATLRHATILVNERTVAECGEGGFEEILMRAPRGYVEPDPYTFAAIADLFDNAVKYVSKTIASKPDIIEDGYESENAVKKSLYNGIISRLKEAASEARAFQAMAEKERRGEALTNEENEKILFVSRTGEHLFLVFNSLSNKDYALSTPDPIAKIADVAGDGSITPFLMSAVGNGMEWNYVVPFFGRHQIVKGSIYSYYEFKSNQLLNDDEWRKLVKKQEYLKWIKPYISTQRDSESPKTGY